MTRHYRIGGMLLGLVLLATLLAYPHLPARIPLHWNLHGQADNWGARWNALVLIPGIMLAMMILFRVLPWLSPEHFSVDSFRSTYLFIMLAILALLACIQGVILLTAMSKPLPTDRLVLGAVCVLFAVLGNVLGKVRRNFYIGVRTPWTLASERVWNATHRLAAKVFFAGGVAGLLLVVLRAPTWALLPVAILVSIVPVLYSLFCYKRLQRRGEL